MNKQVKPIEKINVYLKDYYKENKDNREQNGNQAGGYICIKSG